MWGQRGGREGAVGEEKQQRPWAQADRLRDGNKDQRDHMRWRAGDLHMAWQKKAASEEEVCSKAPTATLTAVRRYRWMPAPAAQAQPQGPAAMLPLASPTLPSSAPNATLTLGLTLRCVDTKPVSPWHLLSLPAAHTSPHPVQPPCLPAVPALSNGAVWLQALILHRARPEAPTQHSCPQWRLPAQGPASCPATHRPEANRDTLPRGGPKQRP